MQLEELVLRVPGDEFRIRFHPHLTVLSGIGLLERQALADSLVGALTGRADATTLTYRDRFGRRVTTVSTGGRLASTYADGSPAPDLLTMVGGDRELLRSLMLVHAADLGTATDRPGREDHPELAEARSMLRAMADQLDEAVAEVQRAESVRAELAEVEAALRTVEDGAARRRYVEVVADLERVRAEAEVLQRGPAGVEADRRLLASAGEARAVGARWSEAADRLRAARARFGDRRRLDPAELAVAAAYPDEAPAGLAALAADLEAAAAERGHLSTRLKDLAASRLPEPSEPAVSALARADQPVLWDAHAAVEEACGRLQEAHVAMGGLGPLPAGTLVAEIDAAHQKVDAAERVVEQGWRPGILAASLAALGALLAVALDPRLTIAMLLATGAAALWFVVLPRRRLDRALAKERAVLAKIGVPSYLAYQMRRVDASVDPEARRRLDEAEADHRAALEAWHAVAGDVGPEVAGRLADEVRSYADALAGLGGAADEIEQVRSELTDRAEPAVEAARQAVLRAVAPFGLEDPSGAEDAVRRRVATGRLARMQADLEDAEAEEASAGETLDGLLDDLDIEAAERHDRVGGLDAAVGRAEERERARSRARTREAVEDDLVRLQAEARRLRRPEWGPPASPDQHPADPADLARRRDELAAEVERARALAAEVDRLADRHGAMERRIAALEAQHGPGDGAASGPGTTDVHHALLAHLAKARGHDGDVETVPVLLDEPFLRIPAERKWELLDMLLRLSDRVQLVYLTDDPYVTAWGRRRATDGTILLLEPDAEPV